MSSKLRRFELLLPVRFNDGRDVPEEWIGDALEEIIERFGAVSFERRTIEGRWRYEGILYHDDLSRLIVDVPDKPQHRKWMRAFKARLKVKFEQLELWLISYPIEFD